MLPSALADASAASALMAVLSLGIGDAIVGSVLRLDMMALPIAVVSTAASMLVMEVSGVMRAADSYFWGFLLGRGRWEARERRIAESDRTTPTPPVADQDGERR